ncbi:hypothetical protein [Edaphobacter sp. DSM 109919]|uniref:DUF5666 domain-containing protein n=1 Tax=Edaphobacter paludis TaxID=3035702 RepID=A0AAU7CUI7_9BACT
MKKQLLLLSCLTLALSMPSFAQTSGTDNSQTESMGQSGAMKSGKMKKMSAIGCIAEKDGKYMLMNKMHPDGMELMSSEDLKPHVGHKVKVTGMMDDNSMKVTSMKMMSTSCDMAGMMKK